MISKRMTFAGVVTTLLILVLLPPPSHADAIAWDRAGLQSVFGPSLSDYLLGLAAGDSDFEYSACPECRGAFAVTRRYDGTNRHFSFTRVGAAYSIGISVPTAFSDDTPDVAAINMPGIFLPAVAARLLGRETPKRIPSPAPPVPVVVPPPARLPLRDVLPPVSLHSSGPEIPDASPGASQTPAPIPEPTVLVLLGSGLGLMGFVAWRRRRL